MHRIPSLREMRNHFPAVQFCPNGSFYASRSLGFVKYGADGFEFPAATYLADNVSMAHDT
jgi:hypothetical protein